MSSRRLEILRAIVDEYVATQEPVGSKAIAERHGLGISPATIRNEMAVLEDEGLITQPHTSAGRIPTDLGYRVFVDKLATVKPLSPAERRAIETFLDEANNLEQLMRRSAKLLADITKQVAVITYPIIGESTGSEKMAISGTANLARSGEDLGLTLSPILEALEEQVVLMRLLDEANNLEQLMKRSAKLLADITKQVAVITYPIIGENTGSEKMAISGTANLARSGEDLGLTLSPILEALEEQVVLMRLLDEANSTVHVRIGREQIETNLQTTSLVSVGYGANSAQLGAVGVLGPTRMDYAGSIAAVDAVARYVGRFLIEGA